MAYRKVYFRIRTDCYSSGWTSDADRTAFKEESRRLFQELGWAVTFGHNGSCDTAAKDQQDLYLHPSSFSGVIDHPHPWPHRVCDRAQRNGKGLHGQKGGRPE